MARRKGQIPKIKPKGFGGIPNPPKNPAKLAEDNDMIQYIESVMTQLGMKKLFHALMDDASYHNNGTFNQSGCCRAAGIKTSKILQDKLQRLREEFPDLNIIPPEETQ